MTTPVQDAPAFAPETTARLAARLFVSLGRGDFAGAMMEAVEAGAGASGCAAFLFRPEGGRALIASDADHDRAAQRYARDYWRRDTTLFDRRVAVIDGGSTLYHYPTRAVRDPRLVRDCYEVSDTVDQVLLRRRAGDGVVALSVFRRRRPGPFSAESVADLAVLAPMLLAAVERHAALLPSPGGVCTLPVAEAEALVASLSPALTRREVQVCARVLRGVTSQGIALELGLSKTTVATFRKRAYGRLGLSSAAELFNRCLARAAPGAFAAARR